MSYEMMSNDMRKKEMEEAINAGERALYSLRQAQEKLNSARTWGIFDLFGGGFITDMIKHSKINDAVSCVENAKRDLVIFQRELRDVQISSELHIEMGGFLSFADFFFDGVVADYLVQSRIADAREQVNNAIYRVENLLGQLKTMYGF